MPSFIITEIPIGYAGHIPSAVFIGDEGVLKYESGTICDYTAVSEALAQAPQAVCLADDGWMLWHTGYRDNVKYGSLDKKVPLTLQSQAEIPAVSSFSADLYLCPIGYLRATNVALQVDSPVAQLREALKIASTDCSVLTVNSEFAEFAESWYTLRPKGYLCRLPFQDPAPKLRSENIPFTNLTGKNVDVDKSPAWSEARDQYYLSRYPWGILDTYDRLLSTGAGQLPFKDKASSDGWNEIYPYDYLAQYPWGIAATLDLLADSSYLLMLEHKDFRTYAPWGDSDFFTVMERFPWRAVHSTDRYASVTSGGEICYLMPWVTSILPDGANLAFDLTEKMDFKRFYEIVRYPSFDTYHTASSCVLFDAESATIYHDGWEKKPKLPEPSSTIGHAVYLSDTGSNWISGDLLEYYELEGNSHAEYMDSSGFGLADPVLNDPLRRTIMIPSPGCYPRPSDNYSNPPQDVIVIPHPLVIQRSLLLMSTASLIRASDSAPIPVTSMSLGTDLQSWCWSFNAAIKTASALELCKPTSADSVELIATVNGYSWRVLIDGFNERGAFGKTDYSISGRTKAVELAGPMAEPGSRVFDAAMNLSQIFEQELLRIQGVNDGEWTGVWEAQDGLIPANTFSYQDKTPIEVIMTLAQAVGAFVHHDRMQRIITVSPCYKKNPWNFAVGDEDHALHPSSVISTGMSWKPTPVKDGIYVSGTTSDGYLCKVSRNGSDGQKLLPMITDPLIVTAAIARERGRFAINQAGKKGDYSKELPILDSGSALPLLETGQIVRVNDAASWYGVITGISVGVSMTNNVCKARQQVAIERHFE